MASANIEEAQKRSILKNYNGKWRRKKKIFCLTCLSHFEIKKKKRQNSFKIVEASSSVLVKVPCVSSTKFRPKDTR